MLEFYIQVSAGLNAFQCGCAVCTPLLESEALAHPSEVTLGAAVWEEALPSL